MLRTEINKVLPFSVILPNENLDLLSYFTFPLSYIISVFCCVSLNLFLPEHSIVNLSLSPCLSVCLWVLLFHEKHKKLHMGEEKGTLCRNL